MPVNVEAKESATMRPVDTVTDRRPLGATARALAAVAALVMVGILVAGCGGGGKSPGVANVSTSSTTSSHSSSSTAITNGGSGLGSGPSNGSGGGAPRSGFAIQTGNPQKALKLSECMRTHGVPNFPDPNGQGVIQGSGIDPNSRQFQNAQQTCAKELGGGPGTRSPAQIAKAEAEALAFSKCMRSHGVARFPDPQFSSGGGVSIRITGHVGAGGNNGLDPNSPIFQKAQQTCGSLLPGRAGAKLAP
jgi:hypothetical protein